MAAQFEAPFSVLSFPSSSEVNYGPSQHVVVVVKHRSRQRRGQGFTQKCVSQGHISVIYRLHIFFTLLLTS